MAYCSYCGSGIADDAVICVHCGRPTGRRTPQQMQNQQKLRTAIKVFLILGCISVGWPLIPLAWCIPISVSICRKLKSGEPISMGLKICALLFVNVIAGVCLLCMDE